VNGTRGLRGHQLEDQVADAVRHVHSAWVSADQARRMERILDRFAKFCRRGHGLKALSDVTPAIAEAFLWAPDESGAPPPLTAVRLRRTAVRLLFRSARSAGLAVGDPTMDLSLPSKGPRRMRPLTDDDVSLCRSCATWSLSDSRRSASWALAEATCRTGELPHVRARDLDLDSGRVWIHGGRRTCPRWGELGPWGVTQLARRLESVGTDPDTPVVYDGQNRREGGRISTSLALLDVLQRAGLAGEPGVQPGSIAAWAGQQILTETRRIDEAARRLGLRSLDRTADFIGWTWSKDPPS